MTFNVIAMLIKVLLFLFCLLSKQGHTTMLHSFIRQQALDQEGCHYAFIKWKFTVRVVRKLLFGKRALRNQFGS